MAKRKKTENEQEYIRKYHREAMISIAFRLSRERDKDLIEKYKKIPNKMEWFRKALEATEI